MATMSKRPEYTECAYCGAEITGSETEVERTPVPTVEDDEAWAALAEEHFYGCEWIDSRAHRLEV